MVESAPDNLLLATQTAVLDDTVSEEITRTHSKSLLDTSLDENDKADDFMDDWNTPSFDTHEIAESSNVDGTILPQEAPSLETISVSDDLLLINPIETAPVADNLPLNTGTTAEIPKVDDTTQVAVKTPLDSIEPEPLLDAPLATEKTALQTPVDSIASEESTLKPEKNLMDASFDEDFELGSDDDDLG